MRYSTSPALCDSSHTYRWPSASSSQTEQRVAPFSLIAVPYGIVRLHQSQMTQLNALVQKCVCTRTTENGRAINPGHGQRQQQPVIVSAASQ